ncbi:hypothetical protein Csa_015467 [Cucumis sativus]|uniref:Uncharacterized protein n=1 Tax=Cucumis sativus TaxID=3659 RepID=A0A0A0LDY8_CUCSA|nr:hypothetical protein Csa_015467 [Cucumis sativus]
MANQHRSPNSPFCLEIVSKNDGSSIHMPPHDQNHQNTMNMIPKSIMKSSSYLHSIRHDSEQA